MQLRGYQREAIDALTPWFTGGGGNPLVVLPTAAGKSVIQAVFVKEAIQAWPNTRILLISHVKELLEQNVEKLVAIWPEAPIGMYSAGLGRRDVGYKITVAGIQSVHKRALELGIFDLVIVDECHLIPTSGDGMYRKFMADQRRINAKVKIIGLTATHYRMKTGRLDQGEDALFDGIAYEVSVRRLIDEGYLSNLISKKGVVRPDLSWVGTRGGEFIPGALADVMDKDELTRVAVDEILALCAARRSWLVFCSGVEHAHHVRDEINSRGISAETITGDTNPVDRARYIAAFKAGGIQVLTNCDVLTTGFDAPCIDALIMLRPTKSTGLYVQMVGRGMRLSPDTGKTDCLVLDFSGNIERHGPIDDITVREPVIGGGNGVTGAPVKECPDCHSLVPISVMECPDCHYKWPVKAAHEATASFADILSKRFAPQIENYKVDRVEYSLHRKAGKPDSMRVDYYCDNGFTVMKEWVCFNHDGYARRRAISWWLERRLKGQPTVTNAGTTDQMLEWFKSGAETLRSPATLDVNVAGKYPEIVKCWFGEGSGPPSAVRLPAPQAADSAPFVIDFARLKKDIASGDLHDDDIQF